MQLIAGDANLQYRFVNSKTSPTEIAHNFNFDTDKRFKTDGGIVQHMTLGITSVSSSHAVSEYKFWDIPAFQSAVLDNANVAYYVYLKVSKTNQTGVFYISESAITLEGVVGYYHLLVGILNSEFDGDRSWVAMYGYSELSPSRLTIKKVVSPSGKTYFDLENEEIGGNIKFRSTSGELKDTSAAIEEVAANVNYRTEIYSTYGNIFQNGIIETTLIAKVYKGMEDMTATIPQSAFRWERKSDNPESDDVWNAQHATFYSNVLAINNDDVEARATFNCIVNI